MIQFLLSHNEVLFAICYLRLVSYDDMWKPHFMFAETITARARKQDIL
jgi:hypothetical protein